jgi:hypothetical protein
VANPLLANIAAILCFSAQWAARVSYSLASMNGAYSLLGEAASAVAEISALICRISRSSVDGCMTFSFDSGPGQLIPDSGSLQVGKSQEPSFPVRHIARVSGELQ